MDSGTAADKPWLERVKRGHYRLHTSTGEVWAAYDWRLITGPKHGSVRRVCRLGNPIAVHRGFVSDPSVKTEVKVYTFRPGDSHEPDPALMEEQLKRAEYAPRRSPFRPEDVTPR